MPAKPHTLLAPTDFGCAASTSASAVRNTAPASIPEETEKIVAELVQKSALANTVLMQGDTQHYRELVTHSDDYTLMSPFGGEPSHGHNFTDERWEAIGRFFRNGSFKQDIVQTYASADMVVLVLIEHCNVEVGGLPAQEWPLRVTLVYRRAGAEWQLVHRHADPLAPGVSVATAAALARGEIK
jgi:ketosteroid isomerase-like protein